MKKRFLVTIIILLVSLLNFGVAHADNLGMILKKHIGKIILINVGGGSAQDVILKEVGSDFILLTGAGSEEDRRYQQLVPFHAIQSIEFGPHSRLGGGSTVRISISPSNKEATYFAF